MNWLNIIMISIGLAMDAFAVSISSGVAIKCFRIGHALKVALFFGGFQAVMPLIGWSAGLSFREYISAFDHWIAFGLLLFIGLKMIFEAFTITDPAKKCNTGNLMNLLLLSLATSIDALAVGISFSILQITILQPIIVIGLITFIFSLTGFILGDRIGNRLGKNVDILGGLILIGIGVKILLEHLLI